MKSFKNINPVNKFISTAETEEVQETQMTQEEQHTHSTQDTQITQQTQTNKKGQKLPRINMAFTNEHLEYLRVISRLEGISITQYVNDLISNDMVRRQKEVAAFNEFINK